MRTTNLSSGNPGSSESRTLTIGGFRVEQTQKVGSGAEGTVYKAVCLQACDGVEAAVGDVVALKVMIAQGDAQGTWRRLEKRTAELARLRHENVVRYRGCFAVKGDFSDTYVVVQDFLEGETLKEHLLRSPCGLDADRAIDILKQALNGLDYVSRCGMVHRDIKPGNIFLCRDTIDSDGKVKFGSVKLIDFEIAHREGGTSTTGINAQGTFDYMAPDFLDQSFRGDMRSDVFSMGVVMHELLSGRKPYRSLDGDQRQANFAWAARWSGAENPIHVSSRIERILAGARDVIARALSRDRAARYADFGEFRQAVRVIRYRNLRNGDSTYRLLQYIGKGGFGEVFKARRIETDEFVAVKHLLKETYADRFRREAKIMQKLLDFDDTCFARFLDFFCTIRTDGSSNAFLVMAYLDGMPGNSLRDAIKSTASMPPDGHLQTIDVLRAFRRYAHGLNEMHRKGIFHRDIKPSNLYYPKGCPDQARIMDLGIARDENGTVTTDQVPGTLDYMPPEVAKGTSRGDSRMDIYALGLCFYEALTGRPGYPRLPSGTAGYKAFFKRAESGVQPVLDASPVADDGRLLELVAAMTDPDATRRMTDAGEVERRIGEIIRSLEGIVPSAVTGAEPELPTITITIPDPDGGGGTRTGRTEFDDERALQAEKERIADEKRRRQYRLIGTAASLLLLVGIGGGTWFFAPQIRGKFMRAPQLSVIPSPSISLPGPKKQERVPVGTVVFHTAEGVVCAFNSKEVSSSDKYPLPVTGQYECVYTNLKKDKFGNFMYAPKRIPFKVIYTNRLNNVYPPAEEWAYSKAYVDALAVTHSNTVEKLAKERDEKIQQVEALVEEVRANSATNLVAMQSKIDEKEREIKNIRDKEVEAKRRLAIAQQNAAVAESNRLAVVELLNAVGKDDAAKREELATRLSSVTKDVNDARGKLAAAEIEIAKEKEDNKKNLQEAEQQLQSLNRQRMQEKADAEKRIADAEKKAQLEIAEAEVKAKKEMDSVRGKFEQQMQEVNTQLQNYTNMIAQQQLELDESKRRLAEAEQEKKERESRERADVTRRRAAVAGKTNEIWKLIAQTTPEGERMGRLDEAEAKCRNAVRSGLFEDTVSTPIYRAIDEAKKKEQARIDAVQKEEEERKAINAERQRMKAMVSATNRVWTLLAQTTPVAERQRRLREADDIYRQASRSNVLDRTVDDAIFNAIQECRRLVVGSVANRCRDDVTVAGRRIVPGAVETFMFKDGVPNPWEARRKGYEPLPLAVRFDGQEIALEEAMFVRGAVEVLIPRLPDGVSCLVDGEMRTSSMKRKPGERIAYAYRRKGYEYVGEREYLVKDASSAQSLPTPREADWKVLPATVSIPVMIGIQCLVDGNVVTGGGSLNVFPGTTLTCTYKQKGFRDVEKKYKVIIADLQSLPVPSTGEWTPVEPTVDLKKMLEDVALAYEAESWKDVLKLFAQAKKLGHELSDEEKRMTRDAYETESENIKTIRQRVLKELEQNKSPSYDLEKLAQEEQQIREWYVSLKE